MSQFTPRFQSTSSRPQRRDTDVKLSVSPEAYEQETADSVYSRRHQDTQKIKNLSFWENTDSDAIDEDEWTERQSATPFILAMVILVVASTLLWFMFRWASGENTSTPPIIPADTTPFKVRPNNPGGMMIPHQDKLVYGRLSQDASQPIERLLPPPEQPMAHPPMPTPSYQPFYPQGQGYPSANPPPGYAPNPAIQEAQPPTTSHYAPPPQPYPPFQAQPTYPQQPPIQGQPPYPAPQGQPPYGPPAPMPPAILPTMPVTPSQPVSPSIDDSKTSIVEGIKPASDEDDADDTTIQQDGLKELDQLIAKEAEKPLKQSTKKSSGKPPKSMTMDLGKHKVQIASLPSRAMAENEMKRLRDHHGSFFDNKPWNIQKINLGAERGVTYRLVVGSFPNHNAATKFCKRLRAEKIGCLVIAPANE